MNATQKLHDLGQSLWIDNITRDMLDKGTIASYIKDFSVTGLTSNPTIFEQAIGKSSAYDETIRKAVAGQSADDTFFDLAIEDLGRAADLFRPIHDSTHGVDGWVSLEVSPLLSRDAAGTTSMAARLHQRAGKPNLFIKIPGTPEGLKAIEDSIFAGVPVNVTLLFSVKQYVATAEAYMRGIERRIEAGLDPKVGSVASVFVSRWDTAAKETLPTLMNNRLGIAVAVQTYRKYRELLGSLRWQTLEKAGATAQRLLWASTGTKDPRAPDTLYVEQLAAAYTINTMPEATLKAFADHGEVKQTLTLEGGDADETVQACEREGIDIDALAERLQREGEASFSKSWSALLKVIGEKAGAVASGQDTAEAK